MTLLFMILLVMVFGKLVKISFKAAWGLSKILLTLVLLPIVLTALVIGGFLSLAFPILIVVGIVTLVKSVSAS